MNNKQTAIFVMTHGKWGEELVRSTEMVIGKTNDIFAFSLEEEMPIDKYQQEVIKKITEEKDKDILIIVDILGGTPSNIAGVLSSKYNIEVLSGLSMQLLIEAAMNREKMGIKALVEFLEEDSKNYCGNIKKMCENL